MAERLHPGVYVEEVPSGVRPIEQVSTSTAGFVGEAARGVPGVAEFITSFDDFVRLFGGHRSGDDGFLAQAVEAFFSAGGRRAYAVRVLPSGAERAQSAAVPVRIQPSAGRRPSALSFRAKGAGDWADAIRIRIAAATHFPDDAFKIEVLWVESGGTRTVETFDDVRMDPESEDYFRDIVNSTSRYLEAVDAFQDDVDADAPAGALIPERTAALRPRAPTAVEDEEGDTTFVYEIRRDQELEFKTWDGVSEQAIAEGRVVFSDAALAAATLSFGSDGVASLSSTQLAGLIDTALGSGFRVILPAAETDAPEIQAAFATRPYLTLAPPGSASTYNLTGKTLRLNLSIDGNAQTPQFFPPANDDDAPGDDAATTGAELAFLLGRVLPAGFSASARGSAVVVTGPRADDATTIGVGITPPDAPNSPTWLTSAVPGRGGAIVDSLDSVAITVSEVRKPFVRPLLPSLGLTGRARGYRQDSGANPDVLPESTLTPLRLTGGTDGPANAILSADDYLGNATEHTGLHALDGLDINLVALPGKNAPEFLVKLMGYADQRGDCFAILDGPGALEKDFDITPADAKQAALSLPVRSRNAALYYPWYRTSDPTGVGRNPTRFAPPSGVMAGIYARTDNSRGVWKAPAGIESTVTGALGLQEAVQDADQDILNPFSVNCLRAFPGTGIVAWGARTLSSDPSWRYVSVRRTALLIKESIRRGIQWAVFEPNDQNLWDQLRTNISAFMLGMFRQGAFQGATPDEAFRVRCDRSTNPQERVDAGIVTAQVAFAPLKPAEFVVIEITQKSLVS
ncbi:MAG TPA: phage tail sheath subtilisin-like domain-containing protein [Polyangiaceae bacterium]|nr:phage tail sheath subtilisin-like domain-containing protein [Polyangiaceae bacterium]